MKLIYLKNGRFTTVDDVDFVWLTHWKWNISAQGYAYRKRWPKPKNVYMHRELMNPPEDLEVDHIDGDPLNNQRHNLRIVTHKQNIQNRRDAKWRRKEKTK